MTSRQGLFEKDSEDQSEWEDDEMIEMMLSGVDVNAERGGKHSAKRQISSKHNVDLKDNDPDWGSEDSEILSIGKAGNRKGNKNISKSGRKSDHNGIPESKVPGNKQGKAKGGEPKSKNKVSSKISSILEQHKAIIHGASLQTDKTSKSTIKEKIKPTLGRPPKIRSNEEFPFSIPDLGSPRQEITIEDIFKQDSKQTINNFLFEAALQRCQSPNHVQNLVHGLSFYQNKLFELGNKDLTSFLGDLGVLYSTEAAQLLEQQMALMQVDFEGEILLRYVDPMKLNFQGFSKTKRTFKEPSREIQIFFDFWEQIKENEEAQRLKREIFPGKMKIEGDEMQTSNDSKISSESDLRTSPVSNISPDSQKDANIENKVDSNRPNEHSDNRYFKHSAKREFELILKAIQKTHERLSLIEEREESDSYQNIFKDEELESLLGVTFNKSQNYKFDQESDKNLESYDQRHLMLEGLRGKISDFKGFSSKFKGTQAAFLRDYSKELREKEEQMFETKGIVLVDSIENQMLSNFPLNMDSDEQIFSDVFERNKTQKSINSKPTLKERLLKSQYKLKESDGNGTKIEHESNPRIQNLNSSESVDLKEYMVTWNQTYSNIKNNSSNPYQTTETMGHPNAPKKQQNFKDYLTTEIKLKNAFEKMKPSNISETSNLNDADDEEVDLAIWKRQYFQSAKLDIYNVRELSQERHTKSARRVTLEKDHKRPLKMASNYKSIIEIYKETSDTFGTSLGFE